MRHIARRDLFLPHKVLAELSLTSAGSADVLALLGARLVRWEASSHIMSHQLTFVASLFCAVAPKYRVCPPWHRATVFSVLAAAAAAKPTDQKDQKDPGGLLVPRRVPRISGRREQNSTNRTTADTPTPDDLALNAGLKAGLNAGLKGRKAGLNAGSPLHTTNPGDHHAGWTTLLLGP
jgi:hypothetical protein